MGHGVDGRGENAGGEDGLGEVLERVGTLHFEGAHRSGEDDGNPWSGVGGVEGFAGDVERVGAVEDHDPAALGREAGRTSGGVNGFDDAAAIVVGHVKAVLGHQLDDADDGVFEAESAEHVANEGSPVLKASRDFVVGFLDGAAGRDEGDIPHVAAYAGKRKEPDRSAGPFGDAVGFGAGQISR